MLGIQKIEHLAQNLGTTPDRLIEVAETASSFCDELVLIDPSKPEKKPRDVLNVKGDLRVFQTRLLHDLLQPKHRPSTYSHGGVQGRHIKSNANAHIESVFAFPTDVANFYPTISNDRVFRLFLMDFCCHPSVARICTQLCTYNYHLALGLITSPILADRIMLPIDKRIANMCTQQGLIYSRFVDDIIVSGTYPIISGSYPRLIRPKSTASGRATRRASSDPACIWPI
jgi:RNA-directed DNA polymerase